MDWASAVANTLQNSTGNKTAPVNVGRINVLERLVLDQSDRERRSRNVLILGVKKSTKSSFEEQKKDDDVFVQDVLKEIRFDSSKVVSVFRFKSKVNQEREPPIIVRLKTQQDRDELIGMSKMLRNSQMYERVFVNKDLNEVERKLEREARLSCKSKNQEEVSNGSSMRWKVQNFRVVPFRLRGSGQKQ